MNGNIHFIDAFQRERKQPFGRLCICSANEQEFIELNHYFWDPESWPPMPENFNDLWALLSPEMKKVIRSWATQRKAAEREEKGKPKD